MILDTQLEFAVRQAVTSTAISTNVYDSTPSGAPALQDMGIGEDLWLVVQCDTTATAAGAATLTLSLESDSVPALNSTPTVHWTSTAIALANLTAGRRLAAVRLPSDMYERYLGVRFTVGTGPLTAGAFSAYIVKDLQRNVMYPGSFTIDV